MDPQILLDMFPNGGYFVEAGAHDGVGDSNTYKLELAGWKGLCVEPSNAFNGLKKSRRCSVDNRCLSGDGRVVTFLEVLGDGVELSGIRNNFYDKWDRVTRPNVSKVVQSTTLGDVLHDHGAPNVIEYLSLDTEGSELEILTSHNFTEYKFLTMLVEYNGITTRRDELLRLLTDYELLTDDGVNLFLRWCL
jgi:hypothetical protein